MKIRKKTGFLVSLLLLFSSCCEITEDITLYKKGNGKASITIDAKESAPLIAFFMAQAGQSLMPDMPSIPSASELDQKSKELATKINALGSGVSHAEFSFDFKTAKFIFSAEFSSIEAWNKALNNLELEGMKFPPFVQYSFENNTIFKRKITKEAITELQLVQKNPSANEAQIFAAFKNARYKFNLNYYKKEKDTVFITKSLGSEEKIHLGDIFEKPSKMNLEIKL